MIGRGEGGQPLDYCNKKGIVKNVIVIKCNCNLLICNNLLEYTFLILYTSI